jgi:hypothetical protein
MQKDATFDVFPGQRPSHSAGASREAEQARIRAMSVEERMRMALSLYRQVKTLGPQPLSKHDGHSS